MEHMEVHSRKHVCNFCGKEFWLPSLLSAHLKYEHLLSLIDFNTEEAPNQRARKWGRKVLFLDFLVSPRDNSREHSKSYASVKESSMSMFTNHVGKVPIKLLWFKQCERSCWKGNWWYYWRISSRKRVWRPYILSSWIFFEGNSSLNFFMEYSVLILFRQILVGGFTFLISLGHWY